MPYRRCRRCEDLWQLVTDGRRLAGPVPEWRVSSVDPGPIQTEPPQGALIDDVAGFDAAFIGISERMTAWTDRYQRMLLELTWHALESAAFVPERLRGVPVGVLAATPTADYRERAIQPEDVDSSCSCAWAAVRSRPPSSSSSARRCWRPPRSRYTAKRPYPGTGTWTAPPGCAPGGLTRRPCTARATSPCRPSPGGGSSSGSDLPTGCAGGHPSTAATGRSAGFSRLPVASAAWCRTLS
ncbi:beta-ketoacyl synthase N-terminal-like domain-containing protein [Streptomyces hokutonensis]|uniref:beta-ketoacyl synthase N-terminal-like domain-containing protein n=1 Tax=Streptomyces hokutonensis TaxID=1306990 RepID=UPI0038118083